MYISKNRCNKGGEVIPSELRGKIRLKCGPDILMRFDKIVREVGRYSTTLKHSFYWGETAEGDMFWRNVAQDLGEYPSWER